MVSPQKVILLEKTLVQEQRIGVETFNEDSFASWIWLHYETKWCRHIFKLDFTKKNPWLLCLKTQSLLSIFNNGNLMQGKTITIVTSGSHDRRKAGLYSKIARNSIIWALVRSRCSGNRAARRSCSRRMRERKSWRCERAINRHYSAAATIPSHSFFAFRYNQFHPRVRWTPSVFRIQLRTRKCKPFFSNARAL